MNNYIQLLFDNISFDQSSILIAKLSEAGFEGFEESDNSLKAFVPADDFNETLVNELAASMNIPFSKTVVQETNWNEIWESNFHPVVVDEFVGIRAGFHEPFKNMEHEIIITPKMSFGTGHHATTYMMIAQMKEIDFAGKSVFDFGTGTGILAILAEKLGASEILAIDHDDWSIENAKENISNNHCSNIIVEKADSALMNRSFDVILANINKNVIIDNFSLLTKQLAPGGVLVLSGLLKDDETDIQRKTGEYGLKSVIRLERHNWLCLSLSY